VTGAPPGESTMHAPETTPVGERRRWFALLQRVWEGTSVGIFSAPGSHRTPGQAWLQRTWIGGLLLATLAFWAYFLNFGRFEFGVQDWIWEWRYARVLRLALLTGQLPLHTQPAASYNVDRFLAIPDVPLGPQLIFLRFLDLGPAALATMLLMVLLGYVGCLALRHRYHLSLLSFTLLAVFFSFNGFIVAHIGIGHTLFSGYFLLPYFVLLVLRLVDGDEGRGWIGWMALVLFGIELQGSTQIYAACMIFLAILFLAFNGRRLKVLGAVLAGIVVNVYRIAPALISLSAYTNRPQPGFISLTELTEALLRIVPPSRASKLVTGLPLGWWELDVFVGILGLGFLIYFGIIRVWGDPEACAPYPGLPLPLGLSLLVMGLFSIGYLYWPINYLPLPLFNLIHVPSRFVILPLSFLFVLGARSFQGWLNERDPGLGFHLLLLAGFIVLTHDVLQNARQWRVEHVFEAFPPAKLDTTLTIVTRVDPVYVTVLAASAMVSVLGLIAVFFLSWRAGRGAFHVRGRASRKE
jgi:hypothetical protein